MKFRIDTSSGFLDTSHTKYALCAREWVQHSANASGDVDVAGTFGGKFENCWPRRLPACRYTQLLSSTSLPLSLSSSSSVVVVRPCGVFIRRRRRFIAGWVLVAMVVVVKVMAEEGWPGNFGVLRRVCVFSSAAVAVEYAAAAGKQSVFRLLFVPPHIFIEWTRTEKSNQVNWTAIKMSRLAT